MASPSSSGSAATPAANLPGSSQLLFHAPIQPRTGSDTGSNGLSSESSDTNPDDDLVRRITGKRLAENGAIEYKVVYAASTGKADDWVMEYDLGCPERINDFEKEDWLSDPTSAVSRYINSDLMPYALAKSGYSPVINKFWSEQQHTSRLKAYQGSYTKARNAILRILAGTHEEIFLELCRGSLQRRKYVDAKFRSTLDSYQFGYLTTDKNIRPCHYVFEFTDEYGQPPTVAEARQILDLMEQYDGDYEFAMEIDEASRAEKPNYRAGFRKHFKGHKGQPRKVLLQHFLPRARGYLDRHTGDEEEELMAQPFREDGYTYNQDRRLAQHARMTSSNYLMNLMEAVSIKRFNGRFRMRGEVIFHCFSRIQAGLGELLWTIISGADTESGHGLSHAEAGISVASALDLNDLDIWNFWASHAGKHGPILQNLAAEKAREESKKRGHQATAIEVLQLRHRIQDLDIALLRSDTGERELKEHMLRIWEEEKAPPDISLVHQQAYLKGLGIHDEAAVDVQELALLREEGKALGQEASAEGARRAAMSDRPSGRTPERTAFRHFIGESGEELYNVTPPRTSQLRHGELESEVQSEPFSSPQTAPTLTLEEMRPLVLPAFQRLTGGVAYAKVTPLQLLEELGQRTGKAPILASVRLVIQELEQEGKARETDHVLILGRKTALHFQLLPAASSEGPTTLQHDSPLAFPSAFPPPPSSQFTFSPPRPTPHPFGLASTHARKDGQLASQAVGAAAESTGRDDGGHPENTALFAAMEEVWNGSEDEPSDSEEEGNGSADTPQQAFQSAAQSDLSGHVQDEDAMLRNIREAQARHPLTRLLQSFQAEPSGTRTGKMIKLLNFLIKNGVPIEADPDSVNVRLSGLEVDTISLSDFIAVARDPVAQKHEAYPGKNEWFDMQLLSILAKANMELFDPQCLLLDFAALEHWICYSPDLSLVKLRVGKRLLQANNGKWPSGVKTPTPVGKELDRIKESIDSTIWGPTTDQWHFEKLPTIAPSTTRIVFPYITISHISVGIIEPQLDDGAGPRIGKVRTYNTWPAKFKDQWYKPNGDRAGAGHHIRGIPEAMAEFLNAYTPHWKQVGWKYEDANPVTEVSVQNDDHSCGPLAVQHCVELMKGHGVGVEAVSEAKSDAHCMALRDKQFQVLYEAAEKAYGGIDE